MSGPDEREFVRRIADGDDAAFATLYHQYAGRLYRYALVRCLDTDIAQDVVQETLLAAWRGAAGYRGESSLGTWLFGICHNRLSNELRHRRRTACHGDVPEWPLDPWTGAEQRLDLGEALARLNEEHREAVFLVYYQGFSVAEAAAVLGIPPGTVKSRLHYARHRLQEQLRIGEAEKHALGGH